MKYPSIKLVFDRRKIADKLTDNERSKTGQVSIEIYYNRVRSYVPTGVSLFAGQWDEGKYVVNHYDAPNLNLVLHSILKKCNDNIREQIDRSCDFSIEELKMFLSNINSSDDIEDICDEIREEYRRRGKSPKTISDYNSLKKHLRLFGHIRKVSDLTHNNIEAILDYMRNTEKLKDSTISQYQCRLKMLCERLLKDGRLKSDPFLFIKSCKPKPADVKYLMDYEVERIKRIKLSPTDAKARDMFLFECYTGMSFVDIKNLKLDDIVMENGKRVLRSKRQKTKVQFTVVIMDEAYELLVKHGGFGNMYIGNVTKRLHSIGEAAIGRRISSHMGRHTFATWALSNGVPMEYVSHMLGHSDIRNTQIYAKVLAKDVIDQFGKLENVVNKRPRIRFIRINRDRAFKRLLAKMKKNRSNSRKK